MGSLKQVAGFILAVLILALMVAAAIQLVPSVGASPLVGLGAALTIALLFNLGRLLVAQAAPGDQAPSAHDPVKLTQEFSLRAAGVADEAELAAATGAVAEAFLETPRSALLLLTPHEANYGVRPLPGKGHLAVEPAEFSRHNPLLRQLDLQRQPILRSALETDPKYAAMTPSERDWLKKLGLDVYAPVFDAGVLTAVLAVGWKSDPGRLRPAEQELLMLLASQAGAALKSAHVIAELKQAHQSMTALSESLHATNEAMAKVNDARSDFLAIASHELRTPITQLLGFADLLGSMAADNTLDAETVADTTDSIVRACIRLGEVVTQILEMAQIDVQAVNLSYSDTTVESILRQALEPYAPALRERRLNLAVKGLRSVPPLRADEQRLVGAFSQIASNAIKYTPDGGRIEISARTLPLEPDKPMQVEIVVADSGIGVDPEYHSLIFEKFYRIGSASMHSTGTTKFMGAGPGLGLPIAKGVIERHGGRVWVESAGHDPDKLPGTRVVILLPIKPPAFDPRALAASEAMPTEGKKEVAMVPRRNPFVDAG